MELSYEEIRRIHRLEKNTSQLVQVEPDFYNELHQFLASEKQAYLKSLKNFSVSSSRDFANLKKMVEEIFSIREKKILNKALAGARTNEYNEEHLAQQETKMFRKSIEMLKEYRKMLDEMFNDESSKAESSKDLNNLSVRILSDIPAFIGSDMKEYGPFSKDDVVEVPFHIGKLLGSRNLCRAEQGE